MSLNSKPRKVRCSLTLLRVVYARQKAQLISVYVNIPNRRGTFGIRRIQSCHGARENWKTNPEDDAVAVVSRACRREGHTPLIVL